MGVVRRRYCGEEKLGLANVMTCVYYIFYQNISSVLYENVSVTSIKLF